MSDKEPKPRGGPTLRLVISGAMTQYVGRVVIVRPTPKGGEKPKAR